MRDKLTRRAAILAQSRVASPVIIKAKAGKLREIIESARPFAVEHEPLIPRIFGEEILPFSSPLRSIPRFNMMASFLPREVIFALADGPYVEKIYPDRPMYALYKTVPPEGRFKAEHRIRKEIDFTSTWWTKQIVGADVANEQGFNGRGVLVSVIDTGASRVHEQISRVIFETTMGQFRDENGHGTWCTTCIGGSGIDDRWLSQRAEKEVYCEGMAPECDLLAVKSLGYFIGMGATSNILQAVAISLERGAKVISMSLGGVAEETKPQDDPHYEVFDEVLNEEVIPVVAAGNEGPGKNTIGSPGCLPQALTVGAYDPITGKLAEFSSRGPTNWGAVKPDVLAPGVNINSGIVGILDTSGDGAPSRYSPLSGTSMATPHVAGLVALMAEAHLALVGESLTVDEIKTMMKQVGSYDKSNKAGWGPITWQIYKKWLDTEYSTEVK